jgi:hypothetical protein
MQLARRGECAAMFFIAIGAQRIARSTFAIMRN